MEMLAAATDLVLLLMFEAYASILYAALKLFGRGGSDD